MKKMPAKKSLTAGSIWKTLSKINVNEYTEEKMGLTYLSWSHAYRIMMENYPEMEVEWDEVTYYEGGTAMVSCTVVIGDVRKEMWLPVMDYQMKSIAHPSSRDISDAKMRCLVKCFSLFGLANYIYAGDGLPMEETNGVTKAPPKKPVKAKAKAQPKVEAKANGVVEDNTDEVVQALKDLCNEAHEAGWVPDDKTKKEIKSAIAGRDQKTIAKLMIRIHDVSKIAIELNDDREQGDLIDA
tara:strand:- start:3968 stop:4687 length:720 start_codon:yes stop_codon:yes gene_type:complete